MYDFPDIQFWSNQTWQVNTASTTQLNINRLLLSLLLTQPSLLRVCYFVSIYCASLLIF